MKKNLFIIVLTLISTLSYSQVIGYDAMAVKLSEENINGTARFTGMSGAFGALGGNISAIDINPAGLAVFKYSELSFSVENNNNNVMVNYFNAKGYSSDNNLDISQFGGVTVFETGNDTWSKIALGFNYSKSNVFDTSYFIEGNSGLSEFYQDPFLNFDTDNTNDVFYDNVDTQKIINTITGSNSKTTFTLAATYDKTISYGISFITHSIDYFQHIKFSEANRDNNNNTLDAILEQELATYGTGIGLNVGILAKPNKNLRLGLSYQTPTWYNLTEEFTERTTIYLSNTTDVYEDNQPIGIFDYKIKTTGKATGSIAYIFSKQGLLSFDYTRKSYNDLNIKPFGEFPDENDVLKQELQATNEFRIGGEYRYKNLRLRGGFHTEDSPLISINTKKEGYSLGLGIRFSETTTLDFSYDQTTNSEVYSFIQKNDTYLETTKDKVNVTLTIGL